MATTTIPARDATAPRKFVRRAGEGAATHADGSPSNTGSASPQNASSHAASSAAQGGSAAATDRSRRAPTDDEILGLTLEPAANRLRAGNSQSEADDPFATDDSSESSDSTVARDSEGSAAGESNDGGPGEEELSDAIRAALDENPELRRAWQEREDYRQSFASPEEARVATAQLRDLDRMDALFFSRRPEDHTQLAAAIASLDPAAFASLAQAMGRLANSSRENATQVSRPEEFSGRAGASQSGKSLGSGDPSYMNSASSALHANVGPTAAQSEFFHATNAAAVEGVLGAIESQVEKLLPEGVSKTARARVVGEIYRELDATLRSNHQLARQLREAFRSGALDADHQRGIVSMVLGRARQALPTVAKRVLNEWTSTIVAANQERRNRQRTAERRVDIAGSSGAGNDGRRPITPRDINYSRMSDADILNL